MTISTARLQELRDNATDDTLRDVLTELLAYRIRGVAAMTKPLSLDQQLMHVANAEVIAYEIPPGTPRWFERSGTPAALVADLGLFVQGHPVTLESGVDGKTELKVGLSLSYGRARDIVAKLLPVMADVDKHDVDRFLVAAGASNKGWWLVLDEYVKSKREVALKLKSDGGMWVGPIRRHSVPGFFIVDTTISKNDDPTNQQHPTISIFRAEDVLWIEPLPDEVVASNVTGGVGLRPEDLAELGLADLPAEPVSEPSHG